MANKISTVANKVIRPTQSAFMSQRNMIEGVIILHKTIHEMHRKNLNGVILKIDFEKASSNDVSYNKPCGWKVFPKHGVTGYIISFQADMLE